MRHQVIPPSPTSQPEYDLVITLNVSGCQVPRAKYQDFQPERTTEKDESQFKDTWCWFMAWGLGTSLRVGQAGCVAALSK